MSNFVKIAAVADIKSGSPYCAEIQGKKIALFNIDGKYFATTNICTHAGGPLCEGDLKEKTITCPWHGSKFDVTTGSVIGGPAQNPIKTFATRVNGDAVEIDLG